MQDRVQHHTKLIVMKRPRRDVIVIELINRGVGFTEQSEASLLSLKRFAVPVDKVSAEDELMLERLPWIADCDAAFTQVKDFTDAAIAESHGVIVESERFMDMLGVHYSYEDAQKAIEHYSFDAGLERFKITDSMRDDDELYRKWHSYFERAEYIDGDGCCGKDRLTGFHLSIAIRTYGYPLMNREAYWEREEDDHDYDYQDRHFDECKWLH